MVYNLADFYEFMNSEPEKKNDLEKYFSKIQAKESILYFWDFKFFREYIGHFTFHRFRTQRFFREFIDWLLLLSLLAGSNACDLRFDTENDYDDPELIITIDFEGGKIEERGYGLSIDRIIGLFNILLAEQIRIELIFFEYESERAFILELRNKKLAEWDQIILKLESDLKMKEYGI